MKLQNECCRAENGLLDVAFVLADLGYENGWRAYIVDKINYQAFSPLRSEKGDKTHIATEKNEKMKRRIQKFLHKQKHTDDTAELRFVQCSSPILSLEKIRAVAQAWTNATAHYIRYGGSFDADVCFG